MIPMRRWRSSASRSAVVSVSTWAGARAAVARPPRIPGGERRERSRAGGEGVGVWCPMAIGPFRGKVLGRGKSCLNDASGESDGRRGDRANAFTDVCIGTNIGSKTISIREEVYERLRRRKQEGESFADVIDRLMGDDEDPLSGFGAFSDTEIDEELERVEREMDEDFEAAIEDLSEGFDEVSGQ